MSAAAAVAPNDPSRPHPGSAGTTRPVVLYRLDEVALPRTDDLRAAPSAGLPPADLPADPAARPADPQDGPILDGVVDSALARALRSGVSAVWTGDHSATVELSRLAGPLAYRLGDKEASQFGVDHLAVRDLADTRVRCAVYEQVLANGSPFEIYRWVNLLGLARVWAALRLPRGVSHEWLRALRAAGLWPTSPTWPTT